MVLFEISLEFARADHLRLYVDNLLHDFLVFTVDSLGFLLFTNVIQRLWRRPLNFKIFLIHWTIFRLRNLMKLVQQMLVVSLDFSYFDYKQNKRMIINRGKQFELTVFVMLMSPKLIIHYYILQLRILLIGSYSEHFLSLYVFFHLDQLFLVDVIRAIKRKNAKLVVIIHC